uniref:Uncharacterized protein n=1 Tax=Picea sitchensis TaxID=3332 RepID=A9NUE6_PICSI|nr:unknown [Picea sitchensis]
MQIKMLRWQIFLSLTLCFLVSGRKGCRGVCSAMMSLLVKPRSSLAIMVSLLS